MTLLRMDCETYPMNDFEEMAFRKAGINTIKKIDGYDKQDIINADPDIIAVVPGYLPADVICKLKKCKLIIRMGSGYDKIDIEAASTAGILVCYVKEYCVQEVAEHAIMLLLSSARRVIDLTDSFKKGTYIDVKKNIEIHRVAGKTIGIIGFGRIGQEVGRKAVGLGIKVMAYDAFKNAKVDYPFNYTEFEEILSESDFISINCPLTAETKSLIGEKEFNLMKRSAILINVARGAICDEYALADALRNGKIAYAGIDVFENIDVFEPPKTDKPLGLYDDVSNIILTPHSASLSSEAWMECVEKSALKVGAFINGVPPEDCINIQEIKPGREV